MKHHVNDRIQYHHFRVVLKMPDKAVLLVVSRSLFLALVMLILPFVRSFIEGVSVSDLGTARGGSAGGVYGFDQLSQLFNDLAGEGLLHGDTDRSLIVSRAIHAVDVLRFDGDGFEVVVDSERKGWFEDKSVDFVFVFDMVDAEFVDRVLKVGGIVAVPLSNDPNNAFSRRSNYKIVYLRRYSSTFVAMRKTEEQQQQQQHLQNPDRRRLCQFGSEAKEAIIQGLEDVLLEPPRRALAKSSEYLKMKMNFLPDLLGNSLENYERRVFVNVELDEQKSGAIEWFRENYPNMNTEFEVHDLEVEAQEEEEASSPYSPMPQKDVSGWLKENVKQEDYVVMKAEAEVVLDMMLKNTICLVDELFLECDNEWWQNGKSDKSKRAYWECVALNGRLRDLGVAVHQWFL